MAGRLEAETLTLTERVRIDGALADATLAANGELWWRAAGGGGKRCLAVESELLGFRRDGLMIRVRAFVGDFMEGSCLPVGGGRRRTRRDYTLEMPTEEAAFRWSERLRVCIDSLGRPKRLFVIINPFGGKKSAQKIFHAEVKPLLEAADVAFTVQETKHQLHAQEIARSLDLQSYDGIVCVSGDGVLVEVINGLLQREDWSIAIKVPLGIIPAGTGNGMAKSLSDAIGDLYSVSNAAFAVIRGHKCSLDVATVLQGETKFFCVLMLTWGLVADIDIESEKYRWMGSARLDFYSLLRIINLRKYHGHVQFLPAPGYETYGEPIKQTDGCKGNIVLSEQGQENNVKFQQPRGYQGPMTSLEGMEWRSLDGPFILVWINNVPWSGEDVMPAPEAKFSDGYLDASIVRDCPKSTLLELMLKIKDGSHVKSPHVTYLKVKAFRLEPGQCVANPKKGGIIDVDGEVIAMGDQPQGSKQQEYLMAYGPPIQMAVDQGLATMFTPK